MRERTVHRGMLAAIGVATALAVAACGSSNNNSASGSSTDSPSATSSTSSSSPSAAATTASSSAASSAASTEVPSGNLSLSETGSTLLYPLFNAWDPAFHNAHSNVKITAQGTGSGTGISQAEAGAADIGASDAYLSPGDVSKNPGMLNIPLAISAQMINYNVPGVSGHLKLTGKIVSDIYQGTITKWNDPAIAKINPGVNLPDLTIVPLHRSEGSGDTFLFTQYLSNADSSWKNKVGFGTTVSFPSVSGALGEEGNGGMVSGCAKTKGCIAYIGISYLKDTDKAHLGEAMLANKSGNYELPTAQTVEAEAKGYAAKTPANESISLIYGPAKGGYPIINYEYAIINSTKESGTKAQAVRAFLSWALDTSGGSAPKFLDPVHFQPLPSSVVQLSQKQIAKIGANG